ncbi:hypothetical protein LguiB_000886 [Lonicera macranthoides]
MERRRLEILKLKLRVFFVHILNDNVVHLAYIYIYIYRWFCCVEIAVSLFLWFVRVSCLSYFA